MLDNPENTSRSYRETIEFYLEEDRSSIGIAIDLIIMVLIFIFSTFFVLDTFPIGEKGHQLLALGSQIILVIFTIEYGLRLWSAENRLRYIFNLYSLIDLFSILPLWIGVFDGRFILLFRWFRVLRFLRFLWGDQRLYVWMTPRAVIFARTLFTLFAIVFIYSGFIYQFEHSQNPEEFQTFLDSFYFSVVTMTTVGFGDIAPISSTGRLFTVLMIMTGVALVPWQVGDLIRELANPTPPINKKKPSLKCTNCNLDKHDDDALFCKRCGSSIQPQSISSMLEKHSDGVHD